MSKAAVFTMKLEPALRAEFMTEVEATHRPASQVVRDLMRDFVQQQRKAREYDDFLNQKIEASRASLNSGLGKSNADVEAEFSARRAAVVEQT